MTGALEFGLICLHKKELSSWVSPIIASITRCQASIDYICMLIWNVRMLGSKRGYMHSELEKQTITNANAIIRWTHCIWWVKLNAYLGKIPLFIKSGGVSLDRSSDSSLKCMPPTISLIHLHRHTCGLAFTLFHGLSNGILSNVHYVSKEKMYGNIYSNLFPFVVNWFTCDF